MTEKEIYIELADRFVIAAKNNELSIHEAAGFECYHAYESLAGAFNSHLGNQVSRSHGKKLQNFAVNYYMNKTSSVNPYTVAGLVIKLNNLRNIFLYPENNGIDFNAPKNQMSSNDVHKLISQVSSIISKIVSSIK